MANQEHLDNLKQGVKVWNQWRDEHPDIRPDLVGADLIDADLVDADLSFTNLTGARLTGANLIDANLTGARLTGADFSRAITGWTSFGDRDLREIKGLDTIIHEGRSPLSIN